jgi:hypothetical protein
MIKLLVELIVLGVVLFVLLSIAGGAVYGGFKLGNPIIGLLAFAAAVGIAWTWGHK